MTKSLTEKLWREELPSGYYYIKNKGETYIHEIFMTQSYQVPDGLEVLAPVPSYDHFSQLVKKVKKLEQQLAIATKALKEYAESDNWFGEDNDGMRWSFNKKYPWRVGFKALKEMEGVK